MTEESIYGEKFRDENFQMKHTEQLGGLLRSFKGMSCSRLRKGLLSMANSGPHTNGSQWLGSKLRDDGVWRGSLEVLYHCEADAPFGREARGLWQSHQRLCRLTHQLPCRVA